MRSKKGIVRYFVEPYKDSSFVIRSKAVVLFYLCAIMMTLMIPLSVVIALYLPAIKVQALSVVACQLSAIMISLVCLRRGRYYLAANMITIVTSIVWIAALMAKLNRDVYAGYTTFFYTMIGTIVLASLFCKRGVMVGITLAFLGTDIAFFILASGRLDPISYKAARVGVVTSSFGIIFTGVLSYLTMYITNAAIRATERESKKSREHAGVIENLLNSVRETAQRLAASSTELSATASSFSANSQSQASSAEEIMATIEEVSAGVENIDSGAREQYERLATLIARMNELSVTIREMDGKVRESLSITGNMGSRAKTGSELLDSMDRSMRKIGDSSDEMTGIVGIINDISDQINLLSLNAAIEAARAGDAGRGFAVVADAISKLADRTASSIREIDGLIKTNNEEIAKGMENTGTIVATIGGIIEGVDVINRVNDEISGIMNKQREINEIVDREAAKVRVRSEEIKNSTEEQKKAVNEIVVSIANVNEITQSNALGSERMLDSAKSFESIADALHRKFDSVNV